MRRIVRSLIFSNLTILTLSPAMAITISTVPVYNAGNSNDPNDGDDSFSPGIQNLGAVPYPYRIGATEVTNTQYASFLSAKAASDPLGLYSTFMGSDLRGGIIRGGSSPNFTYSVKANMGNKPVNFVNWYDAVRFVNWLHNGQGSGSTETGAYTLLGLTPTPTNALSITRKPGATWFLPTESEWYKAAYHQPTSQGGDVDDYWTYATKSNSLPMVATANSAGDISNPGLGVTNYNRGADWNGQDGNVTTVGSAGLFSQSFYGTSDQGGNLLEWNETLFDGMWRGLRGNSFYSPTLGGARQGGNSDATSEGEDLGFRVASVPEPNSLFMGVLATLSLTLQKIRQRRCIR